MKKFGWVIPLAIAIVVPFIFHDNYVLQTLIMVMLYAYWSSAWNILGGFAGQSAMGNGVYIGIGCYVTAVMFNEFAISPWIGMIVAAVIAGVLSTVLAYPCFKLSGTYYSLSTVALLHVFRIIFNQEKELFGMYIGGAEGLKIPWAGGFMNMQFVDKIYYYFIILVMLVAVLFLTNWIRKSKMGYYLLALNTNQGAASSLGVDVVRYKLYAQFISAALSALGGAFYVMLIMYIDSSRVMGYALSLEVLLLAIVGGRGTVWGPLLGALVMVPVNELLRANLGSALSGLPTLVYGAVLMIVIYFMPGGLIIYVRKLAAKVKEKKAEKAVSAAGGDSK